jgi:hypothetical protein
MWRRRSLTGGKSPSPGLKLWRKLMTYLLNDDFKEDLENHVEGCDVVKTEPGDFEALPLKTHHDQF